MRELQEILGREGEKEKSMVEEHVKMENLGKIYRHFNVVEGEEGKSMALLEAAHTSSAPPSKKSRVKVKVKTLEWLEAVD
jgi:hypothetical protein